MEKIAPEKPNQIHLSKEVEIEELRVEILTQIQSLTSNKMFHENPSEKDKDDSANLLPTEDKATFTLNSPYRFESFYFWRTSSISNKKPKQAVYRAHALLHSR
jgi:hypothetical protein